LDADYGTDGEDKDTSDIANLVKDNPKLAKKVKAKVGDDAGSDRGTCLMLGSKYFGDNGEGKIITEPGDLSVTATKVKCPKKCIQLTENTMVVFGPAENMDEKSSRIFNLKSSICGSAIQSGIIDNEEGGDVLLHLCKGRESYISSVQNGISTNATGASTAAF